ncbi:class I SAM-dependent methyltransferase [Candidatus Woesearchaeota archaeon]|jgi:predicted O-methyltransferase YrrM|nr:class I SAM-dependent methyltransferase [Candidatus Woesearchaeota archaeon]
MNVTYFKKQIKYIRKNPKKLLNKLNYHTCQYIFKKIFKEKSELSFIRTFSKTSRKEFINYLNDYKKHEKYFDEIKNKYQIVRKCNPSHQLWHKIIYLIVRIKKPKIIFETGVFEGLSTTNILLALKDNNEGKLISFDLPPKYSIKSSTDLMKFSSLPKNYLSGWLIPNELKDKWKLHLGDSKKILPKIIKKYKKIDIFLHDSLHTYEHMFWEYNIAWKHLKKKGLLLSDDVYFSKAFHKFSNIKNKKNHITHGFGLIIK